MRRIDLRLIFDVGASVPGGRGSAEPGDGARQRRRRRRLEADREVANTLAELIIGGSLASLVIGGESGRTNLGQDDDQGNDGPQA